MKNMAVVWDWSNTEEQVSSIGKSDGNCLEDSRYFGRIGNRRSGADIGAVGFPKISYIGVDDVSLFTSVDIIGLIG